MAYSSFERSINARKQLRDRHGKWVYQGGSVKWFDGASWNSGTVTGFDGSNVQVSTGSGGTATVPRTDVEIIPKKATLGGNVAAYKGQDWSQDDYNAKQKGTTLDVITKEGEKKAAITKGDGDEWHETGSGKTVDPNQYRVSSVINDPDDEDGEVETLKFHDGSDTGISADSEYGQFLKENGIDKSNSIPDHTNTKWFKEKFGVPLDKGDNPGWLDKSTGEYNLEPGDIVFGFMKSGPLQGTGKQKFIVSGQKNEKGQHLFHHLPKANQKNHSPGIIFNSGKKEPDNILSITSAVRPPQTSAPRPKEEKKVTVLVKDLPAVYTPKTGDWVSETEGEGYFGSAQKWHVVLEDEPSKTNIAGDPVYKVVNANGPQNYAPDVYGIKPQSIKAIQVTQERLDEIKNAPNSEAETADVPQTQETKEKSWFSPADDPGKSGDGWHESGPWGKYGAAGVMIQEQEEGKFLIIRRGAIEKATQGKWQLPGGAIEEKETAYQGAARETIEELKASQDYLDTLEHKGDVIFDNGKGWQYTNIAATAPTKFDPEVDILETDLAEWKTREELQEMKENGDLLPAFANHLDDILSKFDKDDSSESKVDISEEQSEELLVPEADENQEALDILKENLGIPKTSVKDPKELDDLPEGSRANMYNTMFKENNFFVKTKDGKWWAEAFGPVPAEPKPLELQDSEDLLVDGFITEVVSRGPEAPQQQEERRVSTGPTDLNELPEGAVIKFSGSDEDKHYTKNSDGSYDASWLPEGHEQKKVTADQVHAVAAYLGQDVEVVNENRDQAQTPEPEIKEMEEVIVLDDDFSKEEMDTIDSLEESPAGSIADTGSAEKTKFEKLPSGFWQDVDSGVAGYTPDEIVETYGSDINITRPGQESTETSAPREANIEDLYDEAGIDAASGNLNGLEEYLQVGDKLSLKGLLDTYPVTKQEDWSWTSDDTGAVIIYPGELDTQDPKNIVNITTRGTVYNNNDNSNSTSAITPEPENADKPGDVTATNNGINIDSNGNQWVPDKNGKPIYNGDIVKNKKGDLGKVSFLQKGGKKVRVETPDGDTKFWNAHLVETTDDAFVADTPKYGVQVNGDGKEYVTNNNGDMIFVGDTVTSPGKAGFTGVVQGFKSNGQFVLVLDPADNKVKPRKTDKITVDESTAPSPLTVPAQSEESTSFEDGISVRIGDFPKAPIGSVFHAPGTGDQFEKIDDDKWEYTPAGQSVPQIITYYDADMDSTIQYSSEDYVWGRPPLIEPKKEEPPLAQWEKELLGTYDDGKKVDPADIPGTSVGMVLHTPTSSGGHFKKIGDDEWGYFDPNTPQDTPVYNFAEKSIIDAVNNKKDGDTPYQWGMPPATTPTPEPEQSSSKFSPGDKITDWKDLVDFKPGEYVNLITGDQKSPYVTQEDGTFHNPIVGYTFNPPQFENAINEGDIEYGGEEYVDTTELEPGQKIHSTIQFEKLVPGDTISVEGGIFDDPVTYEKMGNGDFKNATNGETVRPSAFNGAVNTSAVTYTGKNKTETPNTSSHSFKTGDKIQNSDDLDLLAPGEKVTHKKEETYTKNADGTFKEDNTGYGGAIPKESFSGSIQNGTLEYGDTTGNSETSTLKPGDKVTEISQLENMEAGDVVTVSLSEGAAVKDYTKAEDGLFKSGSTWHNGHLPEAFKNTITDGEVVYKGKEETTSGSGPTPGSKINTAKEMDDLPAGSTFEVKFEWTPKTKTYVKLPDGNFQTTDEDGLNYSYGSYAFDGTISDGNVTYTGQQEPSAPAPEPTPTPAEEVLSLPGKNGKKVSVGAQVTKASTATKPAYSGEVVDLNTSSGDVTIKLPDGSKKKAKAKFLDVDQEVQAPEVPETSTTPDYTPAMYDVTPVTLPKDPESPWYEKPMPQPPEAPPSIQQPKWAMDGLFEEISQSYTDKGKGNFADDYYKNVYDQLAINGSLSIPANFQKNEEKYGPQKDIIDFFRARDHISEETAKKAREHFDNVKKEYEELQKTQEKDQADYNEALKKHLEDLTSWKMANGIPLDSFNKHSFTLSNTEEIDKLLKNQGSAATAGDKAFPSTKEAGWDPKDIKSMRTWVSGGSYSDKENPENSWDYVSWESWSKDMYQTKEAALVDPNNLSTKDHANAYKAIQEAIAKSETKEDVVATRAGEIRNFTTLGGAQLQTLADLKNMEGSVLAFYSIFAGSPGSKGKDVGGNKDLDIQVRIPKGSHAAWLAGKNDIGMSSEMEVLLPPGSKFYVHKVIPGTGGWSNRPRVIVDLVPNDWTPEFEKSKISDIEGNLVVGPGGVVQTSTDVPGTETAGPTVPPEGQETSPPSIDFPLGA